MRILLILVAFCAVSVALASCAGGVRVGPLAASGSAGG